MSADQVWRFDCKGSKQLTSTLTRSSSNFSSWISARSCSINRSLHRHRHHQSLLTGHSLPTHPLPQDTVLNLETHWKALLHLNLLIPQISKEQRFGFLLLFLCVCVRVCMRARTHTYACACMDTCMRSCVGCHTSHIPLIPITLMPCPNCKMLNSQNQKITLKSCSIISL